VFQTRSLLVFLAATRTNRDERSTILLDLQVYESLNKDRGNFLCSWHSVVFARLLLDAPSLHHVLGISPIILHGRCRCLRHHRFPLSILHRSVTTVRIPYSLMNRSTMAHRYAGVRVLGIRIRIFIFIFITAF